MSFIGWLFGADALQAQGDALDAKLGAMNTSDYEPGGSLYNKIADEQGLAAANRAWGTVQDNLSTGATGNVDAQISGAFGDSVAASIATVAGWIKDALNGVGGAVKRFVTGAIPWWVWLALAVGLFLYFGGGVWLAKKLKAKS